MTSQAHNPPDGVAEPNTPATGVSPNGGSAIVQEGVDTGPMKAIATLAALLADEKRCSTGDLAALRRLDPEQPDAPPFWRLFFQHVPEAETASFSRETRWALVFHGLALMTRPGFSAHRQGLRLGAVLASTGYSELRLHRLLRARGAAFREQVPRLCRYLASKGEAFDWARFGLLILSPEPGAERYRREIARDYFRAQATSSPETPT